METYTIRRIAANASYSWRTAAVGKPVRGLKDAVKMAVLLSPTPGSCTLYIFDLTGACVGAVGATYTCSRPALDGRSQVPVLQDALYLRPDLMAELLR